MERSGGRGDLMTDIRDWLTSRNLESHSAILIKNEVDIDVLFDLTDDDMREIGLSLGARKRLRAAIDGARDESRPTVPEPRQKGGEAERRQLTIMFVDLVGSTALSGRLDPEDMREVITSYQNAVASIVTRYEGHVAKYMGDGVLCYFGWPQAHENDAGRAARAALEIVDAVSAIRAPTGDDLSVRVGVATGLVVVGDLIGDGAAQEEAVVGETPNLAARLQAVAQPAQVVVAETTHQLLGHEFETTGLGEIDLKGIGHPVSAWRVDAERSLESRFDSPSLDPVLPMVGRDHELGQSWSAGSAPVPVRTGDGADRRGRHWQVTTDTGGDRGDQKRG